MDREHLSLTQRIVEVFLRGNLTPLLILISIAVGAVALLVTPREEEPQIVVPLADVFVDVPGASAQEVERLVSTRLEKLLYQIDGVEHVYSMSRPDRAVITVRFYVGEDREDSLVKLHNKLSTNTDALPPQVAAWVVKPIEVDDVSILDVTLYSRTVDDFVLRRAAEELERWIQTVPNTGRTSIVGGRPRKLHVDVRAAAAEAYAVSWAELSRALQAAAVRLPAGTVDRLDQSVAVEAGDPELTANDLEQLVVGVHAGSPVYLRDIANIRDGPGEPGSYTRIGFGRGAGEDVPEAYKDPGKDFPAVTIAVAKRKGANAVWVAEDVRKLVDSMRSSVIPDDVEVRYTRDHGHTANEKVNELMEGLWVAIVIVIALIALTLGWREGLIVATAVPITFALTLLVNWLAGYSINRVTLFALTLALGLVVDDPIVDVENIFRHLKARRTDPLHAISNAVNEVRPPIILATLAVIVSFLPMFFITGMMGPYMRPMALNVPLAMFMSLVVAFTVTPWLSYHVLRGRFRGKEPEQSAEADDDELLVDEKSPMYRVYSATLRPLLGSRKLRWSVLAVTAFLFVFSGWLAMDRRVPLKMLPFDNKNELQVVIDMPEGTTLERTEAVAAELANVVRGFREVTDVTSFAGVPSPIDFNGMVRHYDLRRAPQLADLRVNLVSKHERVAQSHDFAQRLRRELTPIAGRRGARIAIVEPPAGPPVIATITVEVYGPPQADYAELAHAASLVRARLAKEAGVVDTDDTSEAPQKLIRFELDREKAALHRIGEAEVANLLQAAVAGHAVTAVHDPREVEPLPIVVRLPEDQRSSQAELNRLRVPTSDGDSVALAEIGTFVSAVRDPTIYHKDLRRVAYAFGELDGRAPAEAILDVQADLAAGRAGAKANLRPVSERSYLKNGAGLPWVLPEGIELNWSGEGEWQVTLDVFRDLGLAFLAACFGIYVLLVHETKSYLLPFVLMLSIPFTIIGILPGFWLLQAFAVSPYAGINNPTFFTATAMIGMIALSGIAVRNAILLIEFLHRALDHGTPIKDAILRSGAVRFRPIFLTAGTAMLAAIPITLDPIFSGLAWALIFGLLVSSAFTLVLVPMVYYMVYGRRHASAEDSSA